MNKIFYFIFLLTLTTYAEDIQKAISPDGTFIVTEADDGNINIVNSKTGKTYLPIESAMVFPLRWTGDSKTLILINHIAGGSMAIVLTLVGDEWKGYSADPRMGDRYKVIREVVKYNTVDLTYLVREWQGNDLPVHFYIYSFTFHPDTTAHTNEKKEEIDGDTYDRLSHTFSTK